MLTRFKKNYNSSGLTLVAALLLLSLATISVMLTTGLIASQIRRSRNTVNSVGAYYAGESAIERGLYYLQYSRERSDFVHNFDQFKDPLTAVDNFGVQYSVAVATTSGVTNWEIYNLTTTSPQHLDIIDPSGDVGAANFQGPTASTYQVFWMIDNCFPNHASDRLETTIYSFQKQFENPETMTNIDVCNCTYTSNNVCSGIQYAVLSPDRYYRFIFRPINSDVKVLRFNLENLSAIKSQANIQVDGVYKNSRYRVAVTLPALNPLSDIFSYVLFSEEDLTKGL